MSLSRSIFPVSGHKRREGGRFSVNLLNTLEGFPGPQSGWLWHVYNLERNV